MRDAATLELVKLLLSFGSPTRDKLAQLLMSLDADKSKFLAGLMEDSKDSLSALIDVLRFRSNVSNGQCAEAVGIVSPDFLLDASKALVHQTPVFEHFPGAAMPVAGNVLAIQDRVLKAPMLGPEQYTSALRADNLRAELEAEIESPCDLRKEYYYLRDGKKRSFVIGTKLFGHLSRVCEAGGQNKRMFLDALGQKVERSDFSPSSKLKSKTIRREILDFIVSVEVNSATRVQASPSPFRLSQH